MRPPVPTSSASRWRLPAKQIAINAGLEPGVVADKIRNAKRAPAQRRDQPVRGSPQGRHQRPGEGHRSALQNAASIAALFLTTEAVVADKPEKHAAPAMPGGDEMGGMASDL